MAKFTAQAGIDPLLRVDLDPGDEVAAGRYEEDFADQW